MSWITSPRGEIIQMLQENWPRHYPSSRLRFVSRRLMKVPDDVLAETITKIVDEMEWPPTIKAILNIAAQVGRKRDSANAVAKEDLRPGGYDISGNVFMTSEEAQIELNRMREEKPEAFFGSDDLRLTPSVELMQGIDRIYVKALRKCIAWEGGAITNDTTQQEMF